MNGKRAMEESVSFVDGKAHQARAQPVSLGDINNRAFCTKIIPQKPEKQLTSTNLTSPPLSLSDHSVSLFLKSIKRFISPGPLYKALQVPNLTYIYIYISLFFFTVESLKILQRKTASWYQLKKPPKR